LHAKFAVEALKAGKHVIVEKPLALNLDDCRKIIEAEKKSGKICAVISQMRYDDTVRFVKAAIDDGHLGDMLAGSVYMKYYRKPEYYGNSSWRGTWAMDGGGALMNQGIHGIDLLLYFLGEAKAVMGCVKTLAHKIEVEDTAAAIVEFNSGAIGVIEAATSIKPGYPRMFELCGKKGAVGMQETAITKWDIDIKGPVSPTEVRSGHNNHTNIEAEGHKRQFEELVNAICTNGKLSYNASDASKTVELICAIYESSKTGKRIEL
jgi:predicted dehydrogenase